MNPILRDDLDLTREAHSMTSKAIKYNIMREAANASESPLRTPSTSTNPQGGLLIRAVSKLYRFEGRQLQVLKDIEAEPQRQRRDPKA